MCWSLEASISTFIIGSIASLALILRNKPYDRLFGIFFFWVIFMQFLEVLMWMDQNCDKGLNNIGCQLAWFQI